MLTVPIVLVAPVETRLTANWLDAERSSSANLMRNRICFSAGGSATCRSLTTVFAKGAASAVARSPISFIRDLPGQRKRIARRLNMDVLRGEGFFEKPAQGL